MRKWGDLINKAAAIRDCRMQLYKGNPTARSREREEKTRGVPGTRKTPGVSLMLHSSTNAAPETLRERLLLYFVPSYSKEKLASRKRHWTTPLRTLFRVDELISTESRRTKPLPSLVSVGFGLLFAFWLTRQGWPWGSLERRHPCQGPRRLTHTRANMEVLYVKDGYCGC